MGCSVCLNCGIEIPFVTGTSFSPNVCASVVIGGGTTVLTTVATLLAIVFVVAKIGVVMISTDAIVFASWSM